MVFVFKTSVKTRMQVMQLKADIDRTLPNAKWNFDLDDTDKVLRVDCEENVVVKVIDVLNIHDHTCEELE